MSPDPEAPAAKKRMRSEVRARREAMGALARAEASARMCERALAVIEAARPGIVAAYHVIGAEADPAALVESLARRGYRVALPASLPTVMHFRPYRPGERLEPSGFGTLAPPEEAGEVDPDLIVAPLVGFDRRGYRLGNGLGHFDRALSALRRRGVGARCLGFAFATQEVAAVPDEPHDVPMDWIVTENETIEPGRRAEGD